jgi:hypothetical protein
MLEEQEHSIKVFLAFPPPPPLLLFVLNLPMPSRVWLFPICSSSSSSSSFSSFKVGRCYFFNNCLGSTNNHGCILTSPYPLHAPSRAMQTISAAFPTTPVHTHACTPRVRPQILPTLANHSYRTTDARPCKLSSVIQTLLLPRLEQFLLECLENWEIQGGLLQLPAATAATRRVATPKRGTCVCASPCCMILLYSFGCLSYKVRVRLPVQVLTTSS